MGRAGSISSAFAATTRARFGAMRSSVALDSCT